MRVLTVARDLGPGGTQRAAQNYATGYRNLGHESTCLAFAAGGPRADQLRAAGIEVLEGSDGVFAASRRRPAVVHIHSQGNDDSQSAAVLNALKAKNPGALVLETNVFSRADRTSARRMIDVHLHLSEWCLWKWTRWTSDLVPEPLGIVVPYAAATDAFWPDRNGASEFRDRYGIPQAAFVVGRVGQPIESKWDHCVVPAFLKLAAVRPDAHLVLIGMPPSVADRVRSISLSNDVRSRIITIPFVHGDDDLRAAYSAIDLFAHAAHKGESFGMVLVESMLCGTPVVTLARTARDNSQVEVVGHGRGGLVAASRGAFIDAVCRLGLDETELSALAASGRVHSATTYALSSVMARLELVIELGVHSDRTELKARLEEGGFATTPDPERIRRLRHTSLGSVSLTERIQSHLIHSPRINAMWRRVQAPGPIQHRG